MSETGYATQYRRNQELAASTRRSWPKTESLVLCWLDPGLVVDDDSSGVLPLDRVNICEPFDLLPVHDDNVHRSPD